MRPNHTNTDTQAQIDDRTRLFVRFVYVSSALTAVAGLLCLYPLRIHGVVPIAFFSYGALNLLNLYVYQNQKRLNIAAIRSAVISFLVTVTIILFSGGIKSPFIFILGVIVLGGYSGARIFGSIYLYAVMGLIFIIYIIGELDFGFVRNNVPSESRHHFAFFAVLFAVYLVTGVFGRHILKVHKAMTGKKNELEKRVEEKEILLRQVHHRVKNNLQTVSSLLNLQAKSVTDKTLRTLITSSQNRVISMAMIHEMLYVRNNLTDIDFYPYVRELTEYLINSVEGKNDHIKISLDIPDIKLGIDTVIPLGLLINEAVTNSLKYGFNGENTGTIAISLIEDSKKDDGYFLRIGDNGIGFDKELDFRTTKSLGLKLIHNLARQLRGSVKRVHEKPGTDYLVSFQDVKAQHHL